jgi:hypothetical protein
MTAMDIAVIVTIAVAQHDHHDSDSRAEGRPA